MAKMKTEKSGSRSILQKGSSISGRPSKPAPGLENAQVPTLDESVRMLYGTRGIIPSNRPVLGTDLNEMLTRLGGISVADACWLFGLQRNRWYEIAKSPEPLDDVSLALLVRLLDSYPEFSPIRPTPKAAWIYEWLRDIDPNMDQRRFSLMLGREKSASHRWLKLGGEVSPKIERLFAIMQAMLTGKVDPITSIEPLVAQEAHARGVDVVRTGMWTTPTTRIKAKKRAPGERSKQRSAE